jgi:hypothetical protein
MNYFGLFFKKESLWGQKEIRSVFISNLFSSFRCFVLFVSQKKENRI